MDYAFPLERRLTLAAYFVAGHTVYPVTLYAGFYGTFISHRHILSPVTIYAATVVRVGGGGEGGGGVARERI